MRFYLVIDEQYINPLINAIEYYIDQQGVEFESNPEEINYLDDILNILLNIKDDMDGPLTDEEIKYMEERFKQEGE